MKRYLFFLLAIILYIGDIHSQDLRQTYINTFVGTAASTTKTAGLFGKHSEEYGQTLPAVLVPHGMNFWTAQTEDMEQKCIAPYYYKDGKIQGFRNSHWIVGGCTQDYGSMTLMTVTGSLKTAPEERASTFSHGREISSPSYYSVYLDDDDVLAEMTAQSRSAIFRFTYDKEDMAYLIVNPNSDYGDGFIEIDTVKKEIRGYNPVHRIYQGWGEKAGFKGYFVVRYDKDVTTFGTYRGSVAQSGVLTDSNHGRIGAYVGFHVARGEKVMVKVGSSFTDIEGAEKNLDAEIPDWDFNQVRNSLSATWEKYLSVINVEGNVKEKHKFYSAMYRSAFLPRVFNDVDGRYPSFSKGTPIQIAEGRDYYDDFSMWDTYRALHPLLTIIEPKREGEIVQSLVDKYEQGGWLPIFPCWNSYTAAMIGDHCTSVIGDAIMKNIGGFDISTAYAAMRRNAFEIPASHDDYVNGMGRRALDSYLKYGYIPLEDSVKDAFHHNEQVSRTLEYAYDDFVLSRVADKLGMKKDCQVLTRRALNYRNVIDPRTGYVQGRHRDGTFLNEDNAFARASFITEGAPCHYTWYVPHDIGGLMKMLGGRKRFVMKLDSLFSEHRYWHGNEPCHQIAYLFDYAAVPSETQRLVSFIRNTEYMDEPGGLSGNDDAGQMSAWYVFADLGFYPVCPGLPYYAIGSPAFERTEITLENGKRFIIKAYHVSEGNVYIQSAKLNGKKLLAPFIKHSDIMNGGVLEFDMGDKPSSALDGSMNLLKIK